MSKAMLNELKALFKSLPLSHKEVVFVNKMKGEIEPEDDDRKIIVIFDINHELRDVLPQQSLDKQNA